MRLTLRYKPLLFFSSLLLVALALVGVFFMPERARSEEVHERPVTSSALSPSPTSPGAGLSFYSDPVTVTLTATADPDYSIGATYYKVDGGPQQTYTGPFTITGTGKHGFEYWSVDTSGIEELPRKSHGFTIGYRHGVINSITQVGINIDVNARFDNFQEYLNQIHWGADCYLDFGSFELHDAATGALVHRQPNSNSHCGNAGNGNTWLAFPPIALASGTYWLHYSGGSYDWITEDFSYTAPVLHNPPISSGSIVSTPSQPGSGLFLYPDPTEISLSATADTGYSIAAIYYKVDGGPQQTYNGSFTVSSVGKHSVEYWSVDNTDFAEPTHKHLSFTIGARHGTLVSMNQSGNFMDIVARFDNFQEYLNQIHWGADCYLDFGSFELYDATTGAVVARQPNANSHCGNAGNGNTWLAFPPLQLATGTYWLHYSGGSYDWITEDFSYTAPVPAHNTPVTTAALSPDPTSPGPGLTFYSDPVTVTLTATADTGYSIANTYYKLDGGPEQIYTGPFTISGQGKHGFEYWSVDNTGIAEAQHRSMGFAIGYQHGEILSISQNPISIDITLRFDNFQEYLNQIFWGPDCYLDFGSFELFNATTGQLVSRQTNSNSHCGNAGNGNTWFGFPPLLLPPGTYWVHYSGGSYDWITDPFVYAPTPKTTIALADQLPDETYSNPTTVTLSAVAAVGTTLGNTYYKVDGGPQQTYTGPFTISGNGNHSVEYWTVDNGGIQEVPKTEAFTIYANQPPTVDPLSDATVDRGETYSTNGSFVDTDSSSWTATVDYGDGSGTQPLVLDGTNFTLSHVYSAADTYTVTVTITDDQGEYDTEEAVITVLVPDPVTVTFNASGDTNVRSGSDNRNYGAGDFMRLQSSGSNRALVRFDQAAMQAVVGNNAVLSAKLRLTITDNGNNWGSTGRTVDVHRLLANWAEGNGTENDRGTGLGATWSCAIDSLIQNQAKNCAGVTEWEMGQPNNPLVHPWAQTASATQTITNNQSGVVEYDVTADLTSFLAGTHGNYGWLVKKTSESQNGMVSFGTKESPVVPQLVVTYQP
jgi:hypothetical protein